jgi:hypothetical protein
MLLKRKGVRRQVLAGRWWFCQKFYERAMRIKRATGGRTLGEE